MFAIAPMIIGYFSQGQAGGTGLLDIYMRAAVFSEDLGRWVSDVVVDIPGIIGNIAPVDQRDLVITAEGQNRVGDVNVYTTYDIALASASTANTSCFLRHNGDIYQFDLDDHWHYAGGHRYVAHIVREEQGV